MKQLKAAVIGCGSISVMHLDSALALEETQLVAVCDVNAERAEEAAKKYQAKAYTDYHKMFEEEDLDVVHICLPHYLHTKVSSDAFKAGIHVICEKPMGIDYEDAKNTVELAESLHMQYGVIFQCRYNTPSLLVKNRITDGRLGKVQCGRITLTWYRPDNYYDSSDWKGTWEKEGGGVIIDQAIHSLDLANWMIDSTPCEIQSSLHNRNHSIMVVEDTAEGLIKYENGALLSFYAMNNYFTDEPIEIRLLCENGNAIFSYDKAEITYNDGTVETAYNHPQEIVSYTGGKVYWGTQHAVQIRQFYRSCLGLEELEISGREALKIQKIVCDIYNNNSSSFDIRGNKKYKKICCLGDSLTEGDYGVYQQVGIMNLQKENYPYYLSHFTGANVVNYGKCGHRASGCWGLCQTGQIDVRDSDLILIMLGTNGGFSITEETEDNKAYRQVIEYCQSEAPNAKICLITPPYATVNPAYSNYGVAENVKIANEFIKSFAQKTNLPVIDMSKCRDLCEGNESIMQPNDGLHFNQVGYYVIAKYIYENL